MSLSVPSQQFVTAFRWRDGSCAGGVGRCVTYGGRRKNEAIASYHPVQCLSVQPLLLAAAGLAAALAAAAVAAAVTVARLVRLAAGRRRVRRADVSVVVVRAAVRVLVVVGVVTGLLVRGIGK